MNKTYACSDLHGRLDLWEKISQHCDESDKIYFLGDAIDRGPDGLFLMRKLLADKRVIYLKGNHEEFFVDGGADLIENPQASCWLWRMNGGDPTISAFCKLDSLVQEALVRKVNLLPYEVEYINKNGVKIYMNHAGWVPGYKAIKLPIDKQQHEMVWNRDSLHRTLDDAVIVHGHTPVMSIGKYHVEKPHSNTQIFKYANSKRIDIDLCSAFTDTVALLDLDTFEPIYFSTLVEGETYIEQST